MAWFEIPIPYEAVESSSSVCGVAGDGIGSAIAQIRILLCHWFLLEKSLTGTDFYGKIFFLSCQ